ncbi:hypothetical protein NQ318_003718 [Aromia moschata]|uniref:Uncharacterized protein n=1 Tax=Aromia moschata TaxID=1265417 RepID=A0AAV8YHJ5_9CUCU|nr:hypothetical protein NQ318_003718 [Aromia moschata]
MNLFGHRGSPNLNPSGFLCMFIRDKLLFFRSCGRKYNKPRIHLKIIETFCLTFIMLMRIIE